MVELQKTIAQMPIFQSLSQDEIHQLAVGVNVLNVSDQCILLEEGEIGDRFYVIIEGEVEVIKALGTPEESLLGVRLPGDYLGEMSLLNWDGRRTASARARGPASLLEVTREQFHDLLRDQPELVYEMVREMSSRLTNSQSHAIQVLQQKNKLLQEAYDELKEAQAQIIEKEKMDHELQLAREIQLSILPRKLPEIKGYDLGALIVPARAVGGDFFDIFPLDRSHLAVVIGDVTDKGVPAAIYMAQTRALLRAKAASNLSPTDTLRQVNKILVDTNDSGMFVTVLFGTLDLETGTMEYARAGHEIPLILKETGETVSMAYNIGIPLGLMDPLPLDESRLTIQPGELLLLYTDGVTDGLNMGNEAISTEVLETLMRTGRSLSAQDLCLHISQAVNNHQDGKPQFDDVTLVAIRYQPGD